MKRTLTMLYFTAVSYIGVITLGYFNFFKKIQLYQTLSSPYWRSFRFTFQIIFFIEKKKSSFEKSRARVSLDPAEQ